MATKETIKEAIHDDLVTVLSNNTGLSDPDNHVNLLRERGEDAQYPFLGFEVFGSPHNRGMDGNIHVANVVYVNGKIDHVEYQRDTELTVDIGVLTKGDVHLKDQLYTAVNDHFDTYIGRGNYSGLHDDVYDIENAGYSDVSDPTDGVHGDRQQYTVKYSHFFNVGDFVPIEKINVSIEDLDQNVVYDTETITV